MYFIRIGQVDRAEIVVENVPTMPVDPLDITATYYPTIILVAFLHPSHLLLRG
jgi:hypothetical protein